MEVRIETCANCGGDKGFLEPVTLDPLTGQIGYHASACRYCDGKGEVEIEVEPITMEDLNEAGSDQGDFAQDVRSAS